MRRSYLPVLFLIVALLITWVLMNSIHLLVVTPSGSSGSANLGLGKGLGLRGFGTGWVGIGIGRFGFGSGLSGFGHGLRGFGFSLPFTGLTIALPIINVAMPKVNVTMPNVNMTMPKANVGMPFTGLTITLPIIQLPGIHVPLGGGGGGGGGGSGSGSGVVGQGATAKASTVSQGTTVKVTTVHVVSITMQWLIYLLIAIIAILIAFSLITTLRNMGGARATVKEETSEEAKGRRVVEKPLVKVERKPTSTVGEEYQQPNLGGVFVPLRGWGGGKLIKFGIDVDLPLVWRVNEPLPIEVAPGVAVSVSPEGEVGGGYVIFRGVGCHEVSARLGNEAEVHRVLVVDDYTREVVEVFERNILRGDVDHRVMTPREICRELGRRGLLGDGDCLSWSSLRVFEDAKYGGYAMDRARYEEFVRGLYRLRESYVRWCA
ncbi:MAG: DUF4129 domain-containing protein [Caldivirga sp.]